MSSQPTDFVYTEGRVHQYVPDGIISARVESLLLLLVVAANINPVNRTQQLNAPATTPTILLLHTA